MAPSRPPPDDLPSTRDGDLLPTPETLPAREAALAALSQPAAGIHDHLPRQSPRVVARVLANAPFEDLPRIVRDCRLREAASPRRGVPAPDFPQQAEALLKRLFPRLREIPELSFTPGVGADGREQRALEQAISRFRHAGLDAQALQLQEAYNGLYALRTVFGREQDRSEARLRETVLPIRYLPELLVAAPVWFVASHRRSDWQGAGNENVRFFCDRAGSNRFAYLFQLYNSRPRPFAAFAGPDPMPLALAALTAELRYHFDFLVIATPYHELASAEWGDLPPPPPLSYDPFLVGFLKQVPDYMFLLGRWSGTGIFPLIGDLMAATLLHLRRHRRELTGSWCGAFDWYQAAPRLRRQTAAAGPRLRLTEEQPSPPPPLPMTWQPPPAQDDWKQHPHSLVRFVGQLMEQFKQGKLFSWLRGEET